MLVLDPEFEPSRFNCTVAKLQQGFYTIICEPLYKVCLFLYTNILYTHIDISWSWSLHLSNPQSMSRRRGTISQWSQWHNDHYLNISISLQHNISISVYLYSTIISQYLYGTISQWSLNPNQEWHRFLASPLSASLLTNLYTNQVNWLSKFLFEVFSTILVVMTSTSVVRLFTCFKLRPSGSKKWCNRR